MLGIGGIGMSALARYFRQCGRQVSGYDRTPSPLTRKLEEDYTRHIQKNFLKLKEAIISINEEFIKFVKCDTQKSYRLMSVKI